MKYETIIKIKIKGGKSNRIEIIENIKKNKEIKNKE